MRYLVTPAFAEKVRNLSTKVSVLAQVSSILSYIASIPNYSAIEKTQDLQVSRLSQDTYVVGTEQVRVFVTSGSDQEGEYLLLLDIADLGSGSSGRPFRGTKDPQTNPHLNPGQNPRINPRMNPTINPRMNPTINPQMNPTINPRMNPTINPQMNPMINPRMNPMINPRMNPTINPRMNPMINPNTNLSFDGPYIYDTELTQVGFLVRANEKVSLVFSLVLDFIGVAVHNRSGGYTLFDQNNEWVGYLVPDGQAGLLRFNLENEFVGFVVSPT